MRKDIKAIVRDLLVLSMSRGKEASGVAVMQNGKAEVLKKPWAARRLARSKEYEAILDSCLMSANGTPIPTAILGHSRLVTDGGRELEGNNQPVILQDLLAVHNGIITNVDQIWGNHPDLTRTCEVDTESLLALLELNLRKYPDLNECFRETLSCIEGAVSLGILDVKRSKVYLLTNTGSLYVYEKDGTLIFASERRILEQVIKKHLGMRQVQYISRAMPGTGSVFNLDGVFSIDVTPSISLTFPIGIIKDNYRSNRHIRSTPPCNNLLRTNWREPPKTLRRCTKCILPETMPCIKFDEDGVCNYCHTYEPMRVEGVEKLLEIVEPFRRGDGQPDCMVMFSGGRDSCHGLHLVKKELGLNPIAFSYDWGVLTDLGRRNQARLCGQLGVEHVVVSADIPRKREYVRKNLMAWLKKPELGMVPILMAGDKQYFYHANRLKNQLGLKLVINCECPLERTRFKSGFCGVNEGARRNYDIPLIDKFKLMAYYSRQCLANPRYLNRSLFDGIGGFVSSYGVSHDYHYLHRYCRWDEESLNETLAREYHWEIDQ
ncbi:MAG: hypothetical protein U9N87_12320, partial [Planctomycetota bacterium]|nr:hypothetical protein [Planctomycetota bacterium]